VSDPSVIERTSSTPAAPIFANILCAVDGSRGSRAAIHQAVCLCEPGAKLHFVAVHHEVGSGPSAQADLSEMHARAVLDEAASIARGGELETSISLLRGAESSDLLLAEAAGHDLLVAGCHGGSRPGGMMLGSTATQLAQHAEVPLLIARRTIDADNFPQSALLATDGSDDSLAPARVATRLAKARGSALRLVYVPDGRRAERYREVLKQQALIELVTGCSPKIAEDSGHVADRICEEAKGYRASMVVIGRRGLGGVKALGSVSERVAHRAQCSVLVALAGETEPK
jgi:nucleotide-binding universal stress UspA family protein